MPHCLASLTVSQQLILATLSCISYRQPGTYPSHTVLHLLPSASNLSFPHSLPALTVCRQLVLATLSRSSYRQPAILPHATFTPSMSNHISAYLATAFDLLLPSAPLLFHSLHVSKPFQHTRQLTTTTCKKKQSLGFYFSYLFSISHMLFQFTSLSIFTLSVIKPFEYIRKNLKVN